MIRFARALSAIGILGFLYLLSLSIPSVLEKMNASGDMRALTSVAGALTAVGAFFPWFLGLYHWGTRFSGKPAAKRWWGVALILGAFIGAWVYWFRGTTTHRGTLDTRPESLRI
jgi:hypothetical protein